MDVIPESFILWVMRDMVREDFPDAFVTTIVIQMVVEAKIWIVKFSNAGVQNFHLLKHFLLMICHSGSYNNLFGLFFNLLADAFQFPSR